MTYLNRYALALILLFTLSPAALRADSIETTDEAEMKRVFSEFSDRLFAHSKEVSLSDCFWTGLHEGETTVTFTRNLESVYYGTEADSSIYSVLLERVKRKDSDHFGAPIVVYDFYMTGNKPSHVSVSLDKATGLPKNFTARRSNTVVGVLLQGKSILPEFLSCRWGTGARSNQ